jgi:hypothetical protein
MYKKNLKDIDYAKLKKLNIKCLLFDLDNTLLKVNKIIPKKEIFDLIKALKRDFKIFIVSNNSHKKRLSKVAEYLGVDYVRFALKPFSRGFRKVSKKYYFAKEEMCIIGDQIMTDVLGGNRYGIYTVLVDPLSKEELKVTGINRFLERRKLKKLEKMGLFKKGEYYG